MAEVSISSLLLIALVAIGTYSLRVSGLLLSSRFVKDEGPFKVFLDHLPSTLLLALVVPSILKEGILGLVAGLVIMLCMYKTKSILLSLVLGVLIVALSRNFL